jgi:hypothetical protein
MIALAKSCWICAVVSVIVVVMSSRALLLAQHGL